MIYHAEDEECLLAEHMLVYPLAGNSELSDGKPGLTPKRGHIAAAATKDGDEKQKPEKHRPVGLDGLVMQRPGFLSISEIEYEKRTSRALATQLLPRDIS